MGNPDWWAGIVSPVLLFISITMGYFSVTRRDKPAKAWRRRLLPLAVIPYAMGVVFLAWLVYASPKHFNDPVVPGALLYLFVGVVSFVAWRKLRKL